MSKNISPSTLLSQQFARATTFLQRYLCSSRKGSKQGKQMLFALVPVAALGGGGINVLPSGTMLVRRAPREMPAPVFALTHARTGLMGDCHCCCYRSARARPCTHFAYCTLFTAGYTRSTSNGYDTAPSLDFICALFPKALRRVR